ncbi:MAG: hypothetical protein ACOC4C_05765 [Fibrobacterota bacterium]
MRQAKGKKFVLTGILVFTTLFVCRECAIIFSEGDPIVDISTLNPLADSADMRPQLIAMNREIFDIFSVPVANAVATLDRNQSLTLIGLENEEAKYTIVKSRYIPQVSGGDLEYAPVFAENRIAYTQTRRFVLFDLEKKTFEKYLGAIPMHETIKSVRNLTTSPETFLLEINKPDKIDPRSDVAEEHALELRKVAVIDTGYEKELSVLKTIEIQRENTHIISPTTWCYAQGVLFVHDLPTGHLKSYDQDLNPVDHPFVQMFNDSVPIFRELDQLVVHPELSMAVMVEIDKEARQNYKVWIARWDGDEPKMTPVLGIVNEIYCSDFQFSPDGKWMVYRDETEDDYNPTFIAHPIDPANPLFIGKPVRLGKMVRENATLRSTAWTTRPQSFVANDGLVLQRWILKGK